MKQWSRKQFFNVQKCQFNILKNSLQSYKYLRHEKYILEKMPYIIFIVYIGIVISRYENFILVFYRYLPIRKLSLSGLVLTEMKKRLSVEHCFYSNHLEIFNNRIKLFTIITVDVCFCSFHFPEMIVLSSPVITAITINLSRHYVDS